MIGPKDYRESTGLDPEVQALAETIAKMRSALMRCGVEGPFVLQIPATDEGFRLSNKLQRQPRHPMNDYHHRSGEMFQDRELLGVLAGMKLRFYDPKKRR